MKPAPFEYERPGNLNDVLALTSRTDVAVKIIAGGQSLGPMLNLRLAQPDVLVDITHIPELTRVEETAEAITLGACITHADIEDGRVPDATNGALTAVARDIAYRAVRNRGTLGGSLSHADPAADWITCLAALGAEAIVRSSAGQRTVPCGRLMTGAFETVLQPAEVIEAVRIPRLSGNACWGYYKISRKTGEMAQAIGAVLHDPERGAWRAVMGATETVPIILDDTTALLNGSRAGPAHDLDLGVAEERLRTAGMTDAIDRTLHVTALKRALARAAQP